MDAQRWLLIINLFISAVGDAEIETYKTDRRLGSFVLFPGLKKGTKFKANMIYELRKVGASPGWLMMDHGAPKVHKFYERRGTFFKENKSFLLTNLTKEDSGVYEQKLNQKTLLRVYLTVMDPVQRPVLRRQDDNETCRVTLRCDGWERDSANLTFQRNGVELPRNTSLDEDLLVIDGNDPQQWGSYTCTRTNLVSLEVSQKLVLEPEDDAGGSLLFYTGCIGVVLYICHLLCLLCALRKKASPLHSNVLFCSKYICGTVMELMASSIITHGFFYPGNESLRLAGWISVSLFSVLLLVRFLWSLMFCGLHLQPLVITVMENLLLASDVLLAPAVFIQYMRLYRQASDLCGMQRARGLWTLFYLILGFALLLPVVLTLRTLCVKYCRKPTTRDLEDSSDLQKGSFIPAAAEEEPAKNNDDRSKKEETEETPM